MIQPDQHDRRFARWERGESLVLNVAPYAALAFSTGLTGIVRAIDPVFSRPLWPTLGLAAAAAGWVAWFVTLHPQSTRRPLVGGLYFAGLLAVATALVLRAPWYGFFAWIGYIHAYAMLHGRWRYLGIVATALVSALSQMGGFVPQTPTAWAAYAAIAAFNAALAGAFSVISDRTDQQNRIRKQMLVDLAEANAQLAATMDENSRLHAQLVLQAREAGVREERQRLAGEIHDTLAQGLIGIVAQLEAAEAAGAGVSSGGPAGGGAAGGGAAGGGAAGGGGAGGAAGSGAAGGGAEARRHLATAARLARDSLSEARRSVRAIVPEPLESARLPDALVDVAGRWSDLNGVPAAVTTTGGVRPLHPEVEVALLRTAQEALSNVAKHAAAGRVGLTLSYMDDQVTLDVRDDGAGFDPTAPARSPGGYGLTAMRHRIARLAGTVAIESEPGAGCAISAAVPVGVAGPPSVVAVHTPAAAVGAPAAVHR
jgi:signal transduction histidine kinase